MTTEAKPSYEELERQVQKLKTDNTQLKKKLLKSRSFTEGIMTYMTEGLVLTDTLGTVIFINQRLSEMLGYLPEEVIGKNWLDMVPIEQKAIAKDLEARRAQGHTDRYEIFLRHKNGHKFPVLIGAGPRFDKQSGDFIGTMGIVTDITERKQVETRLRESEERIRTIGDNLQGTQLYRLRVAPDGGTMFTYVSSKVAELHECKPEDVLKDASLLFKRVHPADVDEWQKLTTKSLRQLTTYDHTVRIVRKSGEIRWHRMISKPRKLDDGSVLFDGIELDVTEHKQVEEELRRNEKDLRKSQRIAHIGSWHLDVATDQVIWTEELYNMYGFDPSFPPPPYTEHMKLFTPESWNRLSTALACTRKTGIPYTLELETVRKDGSNGWLWVQGEAEKNAAGQIVGLWGVAQDISERKQAENVLNKKHEMFKRAEAIANIGSWEWDVRNDRVHWSEEMFRIFGRDPAEGAPPFAEQSEFYANGDMQRLRNAVEICVKRGTSYEIELRAIRTDGEIRHCVSRGKAQYDENGKVLRLIGSFQDITDRKRSENKIKSLERRNQALLDHSPVCHKIVDLDFNLQYMSANGFKMLQLDADAPVSVYGKSYPFYFFPETFQNEMKKKLKKAISTGKTITMEAMTNDFQGNDIWLDSSLIPVFDDDNNLEYITVVSANVTQRKHDEKEKARLEGQLRQAQKMEAVGRLAGGVAHDYNNMLSVILGRTEMALLQVDEHHDLYSDLKEIQKAAQRSADITKQLLAFARKQTISPRQLNLNDTVESMLVMLRRLIGEDIDLVWKPVSHQWPVKMDPSQIDQILANLCINSRDAIAGVGKLTIETGIKTFDEEYCNEHPGFIPGDFVLLAVSDNGCGMDKNTLGNLFEPFFTTKEMGKGTGLGLATVYGIVKQNNGFINVYSEPGQGSTFKIYLPRLVAEEDIEKAIPDKEASVRGTETILLVEDESSILKMTRMMLERKGYTVLSASTPAKAVEKAKSHSGSIDLLMTDVVMPEMNGRDLSEKITDLYPGIRLLFMSGYTANVIAHHGVLDKGVAFIQKPFSIADLTEKVRDVLDKASDKDQG